MRRSPIVVLAVAMLACSGPAPAHHGATPAQRPPSSTSSPAGSAEPADAPIFSIDRIDRQLRATLVGRNWHPGCPVPIRDLRVLTVAYRGFDGAVHEGPLVVNARVADDVVSVFWRLFRHDFPINRIALPHRWREPTRADFFTTSNVTAAFNCRPITEGTTLSQHSWGWAIDINPLENPYVRSDGTVLRKPAKPYRDRSLNRPGMIHAGDIVVRSFERIGWGWGGDWTTIKDYMHFSLTGT